MNKIINFLKMDFFQLIDKLKGNASINEEKNLKKIKDSGIVNLDIYGNNFESEEMKTISDITGNKFHFLIRRLGNIAFKDDFGLSENGVFELMIPKRTKYEFMYDSENWISGVLINHEIEVEYSSEMVGIQISFDETVTCRKAVDLTQELTQNLLEKTEMKAELWLVFNESVVAMPL